MDGLTRSTVVPEATFLSVDMKSMEEIAKMEQVTVIPSYKLFKESKMLFDVQVMHTVYG